MECGRRLEGQPVLRADAGAARRRDEAERSRLNSGPCSGISPRSLAALPRAAAVVFAPLRRPTKKIETDMAVPKRKVSPSRRNMRRAHDALGTNAYTEDKDTGELRRSHHIDLKTGTYRGRQVLTPKED